jgi:hypothetical protein
MCCPYSTQLDEQWDSTHNSMYCPYSTQLDEQRESTHNSINRAHIATCPDKVVPRNKNNKANK